MQCAISRLPLTVGTPVMAFLLTGSSSRPTGASICYPEDDWAIRTPPIATEYDDYGSPRIVSSKISSLWSEGLSVDVVTQPLGENQCHDVRIGRRLSMEQIFEAIHEGRLRVRDIDSSIGLKVMLAFPAEVPTWRRVERVLRAAKIKAHAYPGRFPRVHVDQEGYAYDGAARLAWSESVIAAATSAGWHAIRLQDSSQYTSPENDPRHTVLITPHDVAAALYGRYDRMNAKVCSWDGRSCPVTLAMVRQDVWKSILDSGGFHVEHYRKLLGDLAVKSMADVHGFKRMESAEKQTRSNSMDIEYELDFADPKAARMIEGRPFSIGLKWHFARALQHRMRDRWTDADVTALVASLAEMCAVRTTCHMIHHRWTAPVYGGQVHDWDTYAKLHDAWAKSAHAEADEVKKWREQ